jgi:hypothetical protein
VLRDDRPGRRNDDRDRVLVADSIQGVTSPAHAWYDDATPGGDSLVTGEIGMALEP